MIKLKRLRMGILAISATLSVFTFVIPVLQANAALLSPTSSTSSTITGAITASPSISSSGLISNSFFRPDECPETKTINGQVYNYYAAEYNKDGTVKSCIYKLA